MFNKIFSWFENRLNPYPESNPTTPEKGLFRFIWSSIDGMKGWIFLLAVLTVGTGVMEALLFQFMGLLVDWLGAYTPTTLWQEKASACGYGSLADFQYCMVICGRECTLTNATRGVSNAFALEFPPFDARTKLKLLPR